MRNLLMIFASCGHVEVAEIPKDKWDRLANSPTKLRSKVGRKTRTIYVYPKSPFLCRKCADEALDGMD